MTILKTPAARRSRPLCYVPKNGSLVESCTRTVHGRFLLRPGQEANDRILGVLGRAAEYYDVDLHAFAVASNHIHLCYSVDHALQMSRFQGHVNSNIAREIGRLHGWRDKFWSRRYRPTIIGEEKKEQRQRLKYYLSHGVKEGLVRSPMDWPGPNAARALVHGEPLIGHWFSRTKEYYARRQGIDFEKYDFATRYEIHLKPLPAFADASPQEYRQMVAELIEEIEAEGKEKRASRAVLGADMIRNQDPLEQPAKVKKSPAPLLFISARREEREKMENDYKDFCDQHQLASQRMVEAALQGRNFNPLRHFPEGSFTPPVAEQLVKSAGGFNPTAEYSSPRFPSCFPRAWPFVWGRAECLPLATPLFLAI